MTLFKRLIAMTALLTLAACGGGGSGGSPFGGPTPGAGSGGGGGGGGTGGGGTTGSPTVTLALSSTTITQQSPATLTVTVRDASGNPVSGSVVSLSTQRNDIGQLSVDSVLTNTNGTGSLSLRAAVPGVVGADEVVAIANLGTTTVSTRIGFAATAASATINATISSTTLRGSAGPATLTAIVRDPSGSPVPGVIVGFGSAGGLVTLSVASSLTDGGGAASTQVRPADASVGLADSVVASVNINGAVFQSSVNVQVIPETPTILLTLTSPSASTTNPTSVTATVRDAANNPVQDAVVAFSTQFSLGTFSASTALTGPNGTATVTLAPRAAGTAGADVAVATVTVGNITRSATRALEFVAGSSSGEPTLLAAVSPNALSASTSGTVSLILRDGDNNPVRNAVVTLSTQRGNLANLSTSSVLTDENGTATARLAAAGTGIEGADELVATVQLNGVALQARAGFAVAAAAATIDLSPQNGSANTTTPLTVQAVVRSATGAVLAGQRVAFTTAGGLASLSVSEAVTNGSGIAAVMVSPLSPSTRGAEVVTATTTVGGRTLQGSANVTLVSQAPTIEVASVSNTTVTASAPATLRVIVKDLGGNLLSNALVSFDSALGLARFNPTTGVTNELGEVTTIVSPATPTSAGDDIVNARVNVVGVAASASRSLRFVGAQPSGSPTLDLSLSSENVSTATPSTVTALLRNAIGEPVRSQLVTFEVVRGLGALNVSTALTNADGQALVVLSPTSAVIAGADEVTATVSYAGTQLQRTRAFQVQATVVELTAFTTLADPLSAYGQSTLTLSIAGASVTSPVNITVSSSCVAQGKATLSPSTLTATSSTVLLQYRDNGCGAVQSSDELLAVVTSTGVSRALSFSVASPAESSIGFVSAEPEVIYLRGVGLPETSFVTFQVRDAAGQPLPNRRVELRLVTGAGGVTMEGLGVQSINPPSANPYLSDSDAQGQIRVRVNSGTQPTPIRIHARLPGSNISSVSSRLNVAVGLPSQLNFSMSQGTINIEGFNRDGEPNTYSIFASDRSGNPVPEGTAINFITRSGGQVEPIKQTQLVGGLARATAGFASQDPRPVDGRVTVVAYALGEESFIDLNGNNIHDNNEPFQDLGNVYVDRLFDDFFDPLLDEFVPLAVNDNSACAAVAAPYRPYLGRSASIPSVPNTCNSAWSGAGQVYVRRAVETVLSTSSARPLWANASGLSSTCTASALLMQIGPQASQTDTFLVAGNDTWYGGTSGTLSFIVADANPGNTSLGLQPRLNPMAAGTSISATTPTPGLTVSVGGGSPVPSTSEATSAAVVYTFTDPAVNAGVVFVTFRSPSGLGTTISVPVVRGAAPSVCPAP
jgi:protocatechuate 3,4-dioxygenase beta subunit